MLRAGATLRCGARASHCGGFSCCGARALGAQASVVVARGLSSCGSRTLECRLSSCGSRALLLRGMWDLLGPGLKSVSPALAGGFLTTAPPGKSLCHTFNSCVGGHFEVVYSLSLAWENAVAKICVLTFVYFSDCFQLLFFRSLTET